MSRNRDYNLIPPRKVPRCAGSTALAMQIFHQEFCGPNFRIDPPPPPPILVNCGELREHHHGSLVRMEGKINRKRFGRFIELKDQYGFTQLVSPADNVNVSRRLANMPVDSYITIVGVVKRRPDNLKNSTMKTGGVEVHIDDIVRRVYHPYTTYDRIGSKRHYSTATVDNFCTNDGKIKTEITSREYKQIGNSENLIKWFSSRENTCGNLRLNDVGKMVSLVGWIDKKPTKFLHLNDSYGCTQVLVNDAIRDKLSNVNETNILLVHGRVLARPNTNITHNNPTGEIELVPENIRILSADTPYKAPNEEQDHTQNNVVDPNIRPALNAFTYRSHNCGELCESDVGKTVTLCGWLEYSRMRKFFTLRDGYGQTQVIVPEELVSVTDLDSLSYETILKVTGIVVSRPPKMINPNMATGTIEVKLSQLDVLNKAKNNLPIEMRKFNRSNEPLRMEHRYIDLRFADMQQNLRTRSSVLMKMREYLINSAGFVEIETPTLFRRTPGGAQEFVVPTRKAGQFYSLVQSPQQFKQMLMAGAVDRYFQIARCYRDETTTPNRQPEFTQLDIELSFTEPNGIMELIENILKYCWPKEYCSIQTPFPRMTFATAMDKYGSDKPDTRTDVLLLNNVTDIVSESETLADNYKDFAAYAFPLQDAMASYSNTLKSTLSNIAAKYNVKFVFSKLEQDTETWISCGIAGFGEPTCTRLAEKFNLNKKDTIILAYGNKLDVQTLLGKIRLELIEYFIQKNVLPKITDDNLNFLWIVDFPLFTPNEVTGTLETTHHPFTAPHPDDMHLLSSSDDIIKCRSLAYDLVLNGQEIGGGSIRVHDANLQRQILNDILHLDSGHLTHLIDALESGCPPHGGIALGIDRLLSIMCKTNSIRDVIAFPKSFEGKDLLSKAPCAITDEELKLYHLEIKK